MEHILEKIKDRVNEKDSPIRTVKGVAEAIGMSESGFYVMLKRGTTKYGTLLAIAKSLNLDSSIFTGDSINSIDIGKNNDQDTKNESRFGRALQELKDVFEDQLRAKDRQIDGLQKNLDSAQRMLEVVLGKSRGVTKRPLSKDEQVYADTKEDYTDAVLREIVHLLPQLNSPLGKLVAPR